MRALLLLAGASALGAQSLVVEYLSLTTDQRAAIERNGKDYEQAGKGAAERSNVVAEELHRETKACPLNATRLDILHTESIMLRREWKAREAALVAANQALLNPAQLEKLRSLEQSESIAPLYFAAIRAAIQVDTCAESSTHTDFSAELIEHLGIDGALVKQLEARNTAFGGSVETQLSERSDNAHRIHNITIAEQIDSDELGRLYAAQIAIDREIANRRKRHTEENRAQLPDPVLNKLRSLEAAARLKPALDEARALHFFQLREGLFYGNGPTCK